MFSGIIYEPPVEPWLPAKRRKHGVALRLFCFPYAGGAAHLFHGWDSFLPYDVEVCAVNLPGHGLRIQERPYRTVARLVEDACEALLPELDKPFALFGHSMGAIIAFEQARRLRARYGIEPAHLFVSGRRAPHLPDQRAAIHHLPDQEFLTEVGRMGGAPREVFDNPDLMALLAPVLKARFRNDRDLSIRRKRAPFLPHHRVRRPGRYGNPAFLYRSVEVAHKEPVFNAHVPGESFLYPHGSTVGAATSRF